MVKYHSRMDGSIPDNSILFIGDSITQSLCVSAVADNSVNLGIGGDTTLDVINRLPKYKTLSRAKLIIFAVGINDLVRYDDELIFSNLKKMSTMVPLDIPIIYSAIFPVKESSQPYFAGHNKRIELLNKKLKTFCATSTRLHFVDSTSDVKDATNSLSDDFHIGDGLHLNTKGYQIYIDALKDCISKITIP